MLTISEPGSKNDLAVWQSGFRPYFLGAGFFSIIAMMIWMGLYLFEWPMSLLGIDSTTWHAHEMLFGYTLAVIAGFLLTAVKNWTGKETVTGSKLFILFSIWASARLLPLLNVGSIQIVALLDCLFILLTTIAIAIPVIKVKQWSQTGILSKLFIMFTANVAYYAGLLGYLDDGERIGIYSCFYLVLALIFVMARRVIPFFIEKGIDESVKLNNRKWLDISSMILFLGLWIADVLYTHSEAAGLFATMLFILHTIRLFDWHTKALWRSSMLWVLYTAYIFLTLGFAFKVASTWFEISPFLSVHTFAVGGIGTLTLGMMSRVTLGHTGRNVGQPPYGLAIVFKLMVACAACRVILPLLLPSQYTIWIGISQILWIIAFGFFLSLFAVILIKSRIDGRTG